METASYASPGMSFEALSGNANGLLDGFLSAGEPSTRRQPSVMGSVAAGLVGTALGLLNAAHSSQRDNGPAQRKTDGRAGRRVYVDDGYEDSDREYDFGRGEIDGSSRRPGTMFSRLRDRIADHGQRSRKAPYSRDPSPSARPRPRRRQHSYHTEVREPSWAQPHDGTYPDDDQDGYEEHDERHQRSHPSPKSSNQAIDEALESAVEFHANEVKTSKKQLERALRQRQVHSGHLQELLDRLKVQEKSLAEAVRSLEAAKRSFRSCAQRRTSYQNGRSRQKRRAREVQVDTDDETPGFRLFIGHPGSTHPLFASFDDFDDDMDLFAPNLFSTFHRNFTFGGPPPFDNFFAVPRTAYAGHAHFGGQTFTGAGSSSRRQTAPGFATFTPPAPQRPPPSLLTPSEAQQLYQTYNHRWHALSPTDPNIPYPTRGLHAPALLARDTLWAPNVSSSPAEWSEETVMQANAQAFFLGVVGLSPQYTEAAGQGRIDMGLDKLQASPEQIKQLIDILKKEKTRWHSDRLGRRNGGAAGPNEALQRDEKARAVFHAVCELMESVQ